MKQTCFPFLNSCPVGSSGRTTVQSYRKTRHPIQLSFSFVKGLK